jgi:hypothetical protein
MDSQNSHYEKGAEHLVPGNIQTFPFSSDQTVIWPQCPLVLVLVDIGMMWRMIPCCRQQRNFFLKILSLGYASSIFTKIVNKNEKIIIKLERKF